MLTVLELTQSALRRSLKRQYELQILLGLKEKRAELWEDNYNYIQKQVRKWKSMYQDLAEPLERAARYCAILPPKSLDESSLKRPHEKYAISYHLNPYIREELMMEFHTQQLNWVQAMIYTNEFHNLIHYRLRFGDGKELAYQYSTQGLRIQSKERIMKEVNYILSNAWYKYIQEGGD